MSFKENNILTSFWEGSLGFLLNPYIKKPLTEEDIVEAEEEIVGAIEAAGIAKVLVSQMNTTLYDEHNKPFKADITVYSFHYNGILFEIKQHGSGLQFCADEYKKKQFVPLPKEVITDVLRTLFRRYDKFKPEFETRKYEHQKKVRAHELFKTSAETLWGSILETRYPGYVLSVGRNCSWIGIRVTDTRIIKKQFSNTLFLDHTDAILRSLEQLEALPKEPDCHIYLSKRDRRFNWRLPILEKIPIEIVEMFPISPDLEELMNWLCERTQKENLDFKINPHQPSHTTLYLSLKEEHYLKFDLKKEQFTREGIEQCIRFTKKLLDVAGYNKVQVYDAPAMEEEEKE